MTVGILIPAYNEADRIGAVIDSVQSVGSVYVVDDGSTDGTVEVALERGARVIRHKRNAGKGAALQSGFDWLSGSGHEWLLTMDADGQHLAEEIPRFLACRERTGADIVVGYRERLEDSSPWIRRIGNNGSSYILSRVMRANLHDVNCGFRLIRRSVFATVRFPLDRMEAEAAFLVHAHQAGFRIEEAPITAVYNDKPSHYRGWIDTMRFVQTCFYLVVPSDWDWLTRVGGEVTVPWEEVTDSSLANAIGVNGGGHPLAAGSA